MEGIKKSFERFNEMGGVKKFEDPLPKKTEEIMVSETEPRKEWEDIPFEDCL